MNSKYLQTLFNPRTVAVIGASNTSNHVGFSLFHNLITNGFAGTVYPVNPKHESVQGVKSYPTIGAVSDPVDLVVIAVPAAAVPGVVEECGQKGIHALVIISAGFKEAGQEGEQLVSQIRASTAKYDMSVLGPNCLGFIRPMVNLNASFSRKMALKGNIAFISQSGALMSAILDWSVHENVGFSHFVSIGEMTDIGFHDLIDHFGSDPETSSILIYMESLSNAREFLRAARTFAKTKPIIVLKVGRSTEGAKAALSHTGSITGNDQAFDAAFKRVGIIRVNTVSELFDCAKNLSMQKRPKGNRLAIITNAGGPGVIATDMLIERKGEIARLSEATICSLSEALPKHWSHGNPIDVLGDADPARYRNAIECCLKDEGVDGICAVLTPQAMTDPVRTAGEVTAAGKTNGKPILAVWMGEDDVADGRKILEDGNIPAYANPERAVRSFMNMYLYEKNLKLLNEAPVVIPHAFTPNMHDNRDLIRRILESGRQTLTEPEAKQFLANYGIAIPKGITARTADEAIQAASAVGYPVAMKIISPDILHKTDAGGVAVGISTADSVRQTYDTIMANVTAKVPSARIDGLYIEQMVKKKYELLVGCKKDPIFGPIIVFGSGGTLVEIYRDTNVGLPPLSMPLAMRLMEDTKIFRVLTGYRGEKGIDIVDLQYLLYKFSYLIMDFPEIKELDINPLAIDENGQCALDAKVVLDEALTGKTAEKYSHLAIPPDLPD